MGSFTLFSRRWPRPIMAVRARMRHGSIKRSLQMRDVHGHHTYASRAGADGARGAVRLPFTVHVKG